jgi:rRNA-processing protein FCF1
MKALIDTNIFLLTAQTKLPLFQETQRVIGNVEHITTESVVNELRQLCNDGNDAACTATQLIQSKALKIVSSSSDYADADIARYAASHDDIIVITHDRDLITTLNDHDVTVYRPRQQSHLIRAT